MSTKKETQFYKKKQTVVGMISKKKKVFLVKIQQDDGELTQYICFRCSFDFSVSLPEVQRRTLDVAVKNSGGFLSKDKGLLGKVIF